MPPSPQVHVEPLPSPGPWHRPTQLGSRWSQLPLGIESSASEDGCPLSRVCGFVSQREQLFWRSLLPCRTQDTLTSLRITRETSRRAHVTPRCVTARAVGASSSNPCPCVVRVCLSRCTVPCGTPTGCRKKPKASIPGK